VCAAGRGSCFVGSMLSRIKKAVGHAVAHVEDAVGGSDSDPAVSKSHVSLCHTLHSCVPSHTTRHAPSKGGASEPPLGDL
jgi:hypothetical protein